MDRGQLRIGFQHGGDFSLGFYHTLVFAFEIPIHIRRRVTHFVPEWRVETRIAGENAMEHGRASALQADDNHRRLDLFIQNFRMAGYPAFSTQAVAENIQNPLILHKAADGIEFSLFIQ